MAEDPIDRRDDRRVLAASAGFWAFYVVLVTVQSAAQGTRWFDGPAPLWHLTLVRLALAVVATAVCFGFHRLFRRLERRGASLVAQGVALAVLGTAVISMISYGLFLGYMRLTGDASGIALVSYVFHYVWVMTAWSASYVILAQMRAAAAREQRMLLAESLAQKAQLAALRFQLNPHFLFNTLNAISGLIAQGRADRADEVVDHLAAFLRFCLKSDPLQAVPVAEELEAQRRYLRIEKARFGDRLNVEVQCPPELHDAEVPSLILQPLVENAVKYGVMPAEERVTVRIVVAAEGAELLLRVEDDGPGIDPEQKAPGLGIGLSNTEARLKAFHGARARLSACTLEPRGFAAEVRLPLVLAGVTACG